VSSNPPLSSNENPAQDPLGAEALSVISEACPNLKCLRLDNLTLGGAAPAAAGAAAPPVFSRLQQLTLGNVQDGRGGAEAFDLAALAPALVQMTLQSSWPSLARGIASHPARPRLYFDGRSHPKWCCLSDTAAFAAAVGEQSHLGCELSLEACASEGFSRRGVDRSCVHEWVTGWRCVRELDLGVQGLGIHLSALLPHIASTMGGRLESLWLAGCEADPAPDADRTLLCLPMFSRLRLLSLDLDARDGEPRSPCFQDVCALLAPLTVSREASLHVGRLPEGFALFLPVGAAVAWEGCQALMAQVPGVKIELQ
jgi:hypothetical protein